MVINRIDNVVRGITKTRGLAAVILLACGFVTHAQPLAFPGAVGFGAYAWGGRTGSVYRVTTLADSGPGSFRDAVSEPNRIVIFDVSGYITLSNEVAVKPNITIAGQTAPGGGIAIRGAEVTFGGSSNIIVRGMRFRPGSAAPNGAHCVNLHKTTNVIFDRCSFEYGPWNNIGGVNCSMVTFQRCLIADPINQQFGAHIEQLGGRVMWYRCLFANGHNRQPLSKINTVFINNVVYNYEAAYTCGNTSGSFSHDIVGNYFITGPATDTPANDFYQIGSNQSIFEQDNWRDSNRNGILDGTPTYVGEGTSLTLPWSSWTTSVPISPAAIAFRQVLNVAGAFPRDQIDQLILQEVLSIGRSGPNPLPNSQSRTGLPDNGFGIITPGTAPTDSDLDGMPDYWERATGSDPYQDDAMVIGPDGYAKIEHYLNWLAEPHAFTITNTPLEIDITQYCWGFTNANPTYVILSSSNGIATLVSPGRVRFTPASGFVGLGSFTFKVSAPDGAADTNIVNVLVGTISIPVTLLWRGDGVSNVWAVQMFTNWLSDGTPAVFNQGDSVVFDDTGSNEPAVFLLGDITPSSVIVNASKDYTFAGTGRLTGGARISKFGPGKLTILTTNANTGVFTLDEGVLQLGDGVQRNGVLGGIITNRGSVVWVVVGSVNNSVSVFGNGTVVKRGSGYLVLSGTSGWSGPTVIESGVLELTSLPSGNVTNNGGLVIKSSSAVGYSGTISGIGYVVVNASSVVQLSGSNSYGGGTTNVNGTLVLAHNNAAGTGPIYYQGGYVAVSGGVVITNDFSIPGNATTDLSMTATNGTGVWAGNIVNLGSGASWRPGADTGGRLVFTGVAQLGSRNFIVPRGSVEFASNALIVASGSATALGRDGTEGNRSANITIRDDAKLYLGPCSLGGNKAGGSVTVTIRDRAVLSTGVNNLDVNYVNRTTATNTIRLNGGALIVGGLVKSKTNLATIAFNGGKLVATRDNPNFLQQLPYLNAEVQTGGAIIDTAGFEIAVSCPLVHSHLLGTTPDGGLTKLGAGTLALNASNSYTGPTKVMEGILRITLAGAITNSLEVYVESNAILDVTPLGASGLPIGKGKSLSGAGTVLGNVVVSSNAYLSIGDATRISIFTIDGNLSLNDGSIAKFKLRPELKTNDVLVVTGTVALGGTIVVTNIGSDIQPNTSFQLFRAGRLTGKPGTIVLPPLESGLRWDTTRLSTEGIISVKRVDPPRFSGVGIQGSDLILQIRGEQPGQSIVLLTQTNLCVPLNYWQPMLTNYLPEDGEIEVRLNIPTSNPTRFFMLKVQ